MVADRGVGADADVVHAHQVGHVVVVVQDAFDVLLGVVAEGVGHGGDADQAAIFGAGGQFLVAAGAAVGPQGVGGVVAEYARHPGELDGVESAGRGHVGQVDGHSQVVHPADDGDAEVAEAAGVTLIHAVADVVAAVVGDAGQPYPHAVQLVEALDTVADGQVLQGGQEPDVALLLGGLDLGGVAHTDDAVLLGNVGHHVAHLGSHVVVLHERHVRGALQAAEDIGSGDGRPPAGTGRVVAPLVAADAYQVYELLHHLGEDEGVLVDIDGDGLLGDGLVAHLLAGVEGNDRGRYAADLAGQGDFCSHFKLRGVELVHPEKVSPPL